MEKEAKIEFSTLPPKLVFGRMAKIGIKRCP